MVREGDILAGKYRIEKVLGTGGIGFVVAARHLQLDERVAIKLLLPESLVHPELVARFLREGKAAVKIRSEHVARVHDVGNLENGAPYLVMEYLDGVDLAAHIERVHGLPVAEAVDYVLQACVAIAEAHSLGIVHRDLKPANLFLTRRADGSTCIKVIDFGISKMEQTGDMVGKGITKTSTPIGSPLYMSPEQMTSARSVGPPTDIWALGIILFELLTGGARAFDGESIAHLYINIATQPPARISALRSDIPQALEQIYLRCLEKQPGARFANVAELARALLPFAPHAALYVERIQRTLGHAPVLPETLPVTGATQMIAPAALAPTASVGTAPTVSVTPAFSTAPTVSVTPAASSGPTVSYPPAQTAPPQTTPPSQLAPAKTAGAWGSTGVAPAPPMNKGPWALIAGVAALLLVGGGVAYLVRHGATSGTASSSSATASAFASAPSASASASTPEVVASAAPSAAASVAHKTAPATSPRPAPSAAASIAAPKPSPRVKPGCESPSYVDSQGETHFKKECYPQK